VVELERAVVGKSAGIDSYGDITISKGSKIITTRPVESIRIIK